MESTAETTRPAMRPRMNLISGVVGNEAQAEHGV